MTIAVPRINRLPVDQRGITIADFLLPIRLGERIGPRARHVALIVAGALLIALTAQLTIVQQGQTIPIVADFRITLASSPVPITGQTFGVLLVGGALGLRRGLSSRRAVRPDRACCCRSSPAAAPGLTRSSRARTDRSSSARPAATSSGSSRPPRSSGGSPSSAGTGTSSGRSARCSIGNVVIYLVGVPWLAVALGVDLPTAIALGLTPFLVVDAIKLLAAAGVPGGVVGRRAAGRRGLSATNALPGRPRPVRARQRGLAPQPRGDAAAGCRPAGAAAADRPSRRSPPASTSTATSGPIRGRGSRRRCGATCRSSTGRRPRHGRRSGA